MLKEPHEACEPQFFGQPCYISQQFSIRAGFIFGRRPKCFCNNRKKLIAVRISENPG